MKKIAFISFFLFAFFINNIEAQDFSPLKIEASYEDSGVTLKWIPADDDVWVRTWRKGFRIKREELELVDSQKDSLKNKEWYEVNTKVVSNNKVTYPSENEAFLTKSKEWFVAKGGKRNGYYKVMSEMLYDTVYNNPAIAHQNSSNRYQHVLYGIENYPDETYEAFGGYFKDTDIDTTKIYRYTFIPVANPKIEVYINICKEKPSVEIIGQYIGNYSDVQLVSDVITPTDYELITIGKAYGDSIVLRLAPSQPKALRESWRSGYKITKNISTPDPMFPGSVNLDSITTFIVYPWSEAEYEAYSNSPGPIDSLVFVGAQFLYGEMSAANPREESQIITSMHGYTIYSTELSPKAGEALGLRIVDKEVEPNTSYRYQISMAIDSFDTNGTGGFSEIEVFNSPEELAPLNGIRTESGEYVVNLFLDRRNLDNYSVYFFERSDDGGQTYQPLHTLPISFDLPEEANGVVTESVYTDSVAVLYKEYNYRVRGKNSFSEYSPWFEISGMAKDKTGTPQPIINEPTHLNATTVEVTWDNQYSETAIDLQGYYVSLSLDNSDELKRVSNLLPKGTSTYNYVHPLPMTTDTMYFFHVQAIDTAGNVATSYSSPVNIIDSIPPPIPVDLTATVNDTTGIVTIIWPQVEAKDLAGYRVYFSNNLNNEFNQITGENQIYNFYQDTIEIKTLSEEIYYKVASIDKRHNLSDFSEVLVVKRPDVVPPVAPVLLQPEPSGNAIQLSWTPSSSIDVEHVFIYRKVEGDTMDWVILDSLTVGQNTFLDSTAAYEQLMAYTLRARDDAGLWSEYTLPMKSRRYFDEAIDGVGAVSATFDKKKNNVSIQWDFTIPDIDYLAGQDYRYMVYRAEADGPMQRYRQLRGKDPTYIDKEIEEDKSYRYALMVVFETGKKSSLSEEALVVIPKKEE